MTKQSNTNGQNGTQQPKTKPAWEIFIVGEDGKILERTWKNENTGAAGTTWDKRGALWENKTKGGEARLGGTLRLPDGSEIRLALCRPRRRKTAAA